jgi:hypothetical protein
MDQISSGFIVTSVTSKEKEYTDQGHSVNNTLLLFSLTSETVCVPFLSGYPKERIPFRGCGSK